jgi:lipopolysaccharide export system ATP-binding protein
MSILKADGLIKKFGLRTVVKGVSLEVRSGEIIGLLGRNGAGKTTTFQMIIGLVRPDGGRIHLDEEDISGKPTSARARLGISYLPQENSVFLKATVEGNLRMILELLPYPKSEQKEIAAGLLEELGLAGLKKQPAHSLSGGERRKLEICRSLLLKPKFLILDEPFTGIDPLTIQELQKIFLDQKAKNIGLIISDHNVLDTFKITDRAYIIEEGLVLVQGTPAGIAAYEPARERFLGKEFVLGGEVLSPYATRTGRPTSRPGKRETGKNSTPAG